jgi:parallel beta-helix repeat protein
MVITIAIVATFVLGILSVWNPGHTGPVKRALTSYTVHTPITIMGDSGFTNANGVSNGTGTPTDPYIIADWEIDASLSGVGILVYSTAACYVIQDVHVHGAGSIGVELYSAPNGDVQGCLLDDGIMGIALLDSSDCNVSGNAVTAQDFVGIAVMSSDRVDVSGNNCSHDNITGVLAGGLMNLNITGNTVVSNNFTGVMLSNVTDVLVSGNNASENGYFGIGMNDTHQATIVNNDIDLNGLGVLVMNSSLVAVYHNRFIGNTEQAMDDNNTLIAWDDGYPSGGNYWSDYAGVDQKNGPNQDLPGADGIGDTPYAINATSVDRYPLMNPSGPLIPEFGALVLPTIGMMVVVMAAVLIARSRRAKT